MSDTQRNTASLSDHWKWVGYRFCRHLVRTASLFGWSIRCFGLEHYPTTGGGLVCSNHQSHFDPMAIGICCRRNMNFLARKSLYRFKPFGALIGFLNAIPIDREGMSLAGIKETIRRCRNGELLLLFPEGARCYDGELGPFLPGVVSVAKRSKVPLIPVALDGAFQAWPRTQALPRPGIIVIQIGAPIQPAEYAQLTEVELLHLLRSRIQDCFELARDKRIRHQAI